MYAKGLFNASCSAVRYRAAPNTALRSAVSCLGIFQAIGFGVTGHGVTFFFGHCPRRITLVSRRILARFGHFFSGGAFGIRGFFCQLGIGLGRHVGALGFFTADIFGVASGVVTFFFGYVVRGICFGHAQGIAVLYRRAKLVFQGRFGNLFLALGFFNTDVLGVAAQGLAGRTVCLVLGRGFCLGGVVLSLRQVRSDDAGAGQ